MLISEQLHNIIRTIQNQCTTGEQMDVLSYFMSDSRKITDFVFVDKGESDDTVRFFNSKVSKNDVVYTLPNPTVVGLDHEIYQPTLKAIKAESVDLDAYRLVKSKIMQNSLAARTKFKIVAEYVAGGQYDREYKVIRLASVDAATPFEVLHADSKVNTALRPVIENGLLEGITIKPTEIKFGRFLTKVLTELKKDNSYINFNAKDIETFVNLYKAHNAFDRNAFEYFKVVEGEEIKKWYLASTYANGCGTLNNSCMRLDKCQDFFDIYTNPDNKVKMLILTDTEDKLVGRCLLWETEQGKYMDRVYANDHIQNLFKKWAEGNEYDLTHYKNSQSNDKGLTVKIKVNFNKLFPYLDSFRFMTFDQKDQNNTATLSTQEPTIDRDRVRYFLLNETDGRFQLRN
jgi:hypothetical protein